VRCSAHDRDPLGALTTSAVTKLIGGYTGTVRSIGYAVVCANIGDKGIRYTKEVQC
jgi:hypothetical protein